MAIKNEFQNIIKVKSRKNMKTTTNKLWISSFLAITLGLSVANLKIFDGE